MMNMRTEDEDGTNIVKKGMDVVKYSESDVIMKTEDDDGPFAAVDTERQFEGYKRPGIGYPMQPKLLGLVHPKRYIRDSFFSSQHFEYLLEGMFPSQVWKDGDKIMGKSAATAQVSRTEIRDFQDGIKLKEAYLGIKKHGHSKMKVELNLRCLDELIRQDTLNCAERGMFLKDIRDFLGFQFKIYHRMTYDVIRLCRREMLKIQEEGSITALKKERTIIVDEIHDLTKALEEKEVLYESLEREYKCDAEAISKVREDEIIAIRKCNINLLSMLEIVNPDCRELPEIRESIKQARKAMAVNKEPGED